MADQSTQPQKTSRVGLYICLLVMGYLALQLHEEQKRTTPPPQAPLPTFESRVEPLREEASDWAAGYYFHVEKHPPLGRTQLQLVAVQEQQTEAQRQQELTTILEKGRAAEDPVVRSMREANERWAAYERSQGW